SIRLPEVVSPAPGAGFEKSSGSASAGPSLFARNRAPVIRVRCEQARPALNALVSFGQLFHSSRTFSDYDITWMNGVVRDLALMQSRKNSAFSENKNGASGISLTQKFGSVQCRRIKMPGR